MAISACLAFGFPKISAICGFGVALAEVLVPKKLCILHQHTVHQHQHPPAASDSTDGAPLHDSGQRRSAQEALGCEVTSEALLVANVQRWHGKT